MVKVKKLKKPKKFYITTAIPYINAPPHIGHALEFIQTDTLTRFHRSLGDDVFFLTGTDENAQKNVLAAEEKGISVEKLVEENTNIFKKTLKNLNISNDGFIRTTDRTKHWPGAIEIWKRCDKSGDIYKKSYTGLYCVGCEAFLTEKDLKDGLCPEHLKPPEKISEENYFFRLSKYQKKLEKLIESDELKIIPESRKNEILSFIKSGLEDFSVSRPTERMKGWGIPVPNDKNQTIYVWFDALINYISGLGYGSKDELFKKYWPVDIHVIGKGIIRFHAVYWPAMLISAGLPLPKSIFVHGYITAEGKKISKSLGNVIDPNAMVEKYGLDSLRYFMSREISPFEDGDFSEKTLIDRVNNELVANLGNFIFRTLSFIDRYFERKTPEPRELTKEDKELIRKIEEYSNKIGKLLDKIELRDALQQILELSAEGNKYFQDNKPWELIKKDKKRCGTVLYICVNLCRTLAILVSPFLPNASQELWKQLNLEGNPEKGSWNDASRLGIKAKHKINKPKILFQKLEKEPSEEHVIEKRKVKFIVTPEVKKLGIKARAAVIYGANIKKKNPGLEEFKRQTIEKIDYNVKDNKILQGFREIYDKLGVSDESSGAESLINFVKEKGKLPQINTAVDCYNALSIQSSLAMGAHDLDKIKGNLALKITTGNEIYIPLGEKNPVKVGKGKYACMDNEKIICWLNTKQCDQSKTTLDTKNFVVYLEGNKNTPDDYLDRWIKKVAETLVKFNGREYEILNINGKEEKNMISFKDFKKMEMRVGTVKKAERVPDSKKLIKMRVSFGDEERQVVAGLIGHYEPKDLEKKQFIFVTNLEPAKLMGIDSEAMVLAAVEGKEEKVVLIKPDKEVSNGTLIE